MDNHDCKLSPDSGCRGCDIAFEDIGISAYEYDSLLLQKLVEAEDLTQPH